MRRSVLSRHYTRTRAALHRSATPNQRTPILSGFFSQGAPSPIENRQSLRYLLLHPNRKAADLANKSKPYDTIGGEKKRAAHDIFEALFVSCNVIAPHSSSPRQKSAQKKKDAASPPRQPVESSPRPPSRANPAGSRAKRHCAWHMILSQTFPRETLIPVPRLWQSETQCLYRVSLSKAPPRPPSRASPAGSRAKRRCAWHMLLSRTFRKRR